MTDSILHSVKKYLGIDEAYNVFDLDIITHINSAFFTLQQLGVGPTSGFMIEDGEPTWDHFLGAKNNLLAVKSYVYLKVRLIFDPPATSFHISAIEKQIAEYEWRLNAEVEKSPIDIYLPEPTVNPEIPVPVWVINGGGA